jgi:hypothetical protein
MDEPGDNIKEMGETKSYPALPAVALVGNCRFWYVSAACSDDIAESESRMLRANCSRDTFSNIPTLNIKPPLFE